MSPLSIARFLPLLVLALPACAESSGVAPGAVPSPPVLDEDDLWSMVPAEADLVLWVDMDKLRVSPWTRDGFAKVEVESARDGAAGLEPMRDVDRLIFAKVPSLRDGATVLVAQGKIDRERILKSFLRDHAESGAGMYRGAKLHERGEEALAFVGKQTVISGLTVAVRAAIDCNFGVTRAIESESWFARLRTDLLPRRDASSLVAALYVHLQPATREALVQEMGEGDTLEEFAGRVDLAGDLDASVLGVVRTEREAQDMAARLNGRMRDARVRPIVAAFGLARVLDSVVFEAKDTQVRGTLHVSESERADIAQRMAIAADTMARMRRAENRTGNKPEESPQEKKDP